MFGLLNHLDITKDIHSAIYSSIDYLTKQLEIESLRFVIEKNIIKTSEHFYIMENEPIDLFLSTILKQDRFQTRSVSSINIEKLCMTITTIKLDTYTLGQNYQ